MPATASGAFTNQELMVIEAARHIQDGYVVLVGTGLPMVATTFAQKTHAPDLICVVESGPIAPEVIPTPISVSDPKIMHRAVRLGAKREVLGCILQRGLVDIGFLGGAQIDQYGNINTTVIGDYRKPTRRLPGSGGANDVASHSKRILIITKHEKRRFPAHCDYITSPGYIFGPEGRIKAGLKVTTPPITIVTDLAVMEINRESPAMQIVKLMPGVKLEMILENLQFTPMLSPRLAEVESPTAEQVRILREEVDPMRVYLKADSPAGD
ncbi:MAG TPA: CoA-transferase [Candidatus Methylomirabilis sp.]|nr:CoA-transferase [Candidatus Methylomirabilis sp.]